MKKLLSSLSTTLLLTSGVLAADSDPRVEIGIDRVFAPTQGYDDNDRVQAVVTARLPNACYRQAELEYRIDPSKLTITLHQWAKRSLTGPCADEQNLPSDLREVVPFSTELTLGELPLGNYRFIYHSRSGEQTRRLEVAAAPTSTIDTLRYATVTNAYVNDYIPTTQKEIEVRLTLLLTSSCTRVDDNPVTTLQDSVVVVLPVLKSTSDLCLPVSRPVYKVFQIANPGLGQYLLHVRSLGGNSANKLFAVTDL